MINLDDHAFIVKKIIAWTDSTKFNLPDEMSRLRAKLELYQRKAKTLDELTISYNEYQTRLAQSKNERIQDLVEKQQSFYRKVGLQT